MKRELAMVALVALTVPAVRVVMFPVVVLTDPPPIEPAVMVFAAKLPEPSRFTIVLAVSLLVGAAVHLKLSVPLLVMGEPDTVKSELGALKPTLVTVPFPDAVAHTQALPFHCRV
jgi:hypothetical protein